MFSKPAFMMFTDILFQKIIMLFTSIKEWTLPSEQVQIYNVQENQSGVFGVEFFCLFGVAFLPASEHVIVWKGSSK